MPGKWATARRHRGIGSGNGQVAVGGIPTKLHMRARVIMHHAPALLGEFIPRAVTRTSVRGYNRLHVVI